MLNFLTGYRTYLTAGANILLALATMLTVISTQMGALSLDHGATLALSLASAATALNALAHIFQRAATDNAATAIIETLKRLFDRTDTTPPNGPTDPFSGVPVRPSEPLKPLIPLLLLAFLFSSGNLWAGETKQLKAKIIAPKTAEPGDDIYFDGTQSEGDIKLYKWRVSPVLEDKTQITVDPINKGKMRLASYSGTYILTLMITDGITDIVTVNHQIKVSGTPPCPPIPDPLPNPMPLPIPPTPIPIVPTPVPSPTPNPSPIPMPDLPPGEFDGLPATVKALALSVVSVSRTAEAAKLADAFDTLAAQIAAGALKNPVAIVSAIGAAFNTATTAAWDTDFRMKALAKMKALYDANKLPTPERWRAMILEVVVGLRAVK